MGNKRSYLHHYDHGCFDLSVHRRTPLEAEALLQGLGREEEDIVHTETDYIADGVLTAVPDTHPEVNMVEEVQVKKAL